MVKSFSKFCIVLICLLLTKVNCFSQALTSQQIDSLVTKTMKTFDVPGMAVAVMKDGNVVSKKAYGVRSLATGKPVTTETLFGVASNTKAFTTAALAQLIDAGKLNWDTKVTDVIPEFKLYDPYVTSEFTVRDLITHRSGLGLGAGDLMIFPANNTTTKAEMVHNLRYLKPVSSFRSKFDYDNLLYIVAGEVVARVSGVPYEQYIETHFFEPLQLNRMTMNMQEITNDANRIDGHAPVNGKLEITGDTFTKLAKPAGGIYASIDAMATWVQAQLDHGKYGSKPQDSLFSEAAQREMWTPQTLIRSGGAYNTHFSAYGLGWFLSDVNGYFQVTHTGGLLGIVSQVTMIPELDLGIIVLTNQQSGAAFRAITNSIKDGYFGITDANRVEQYNDSRLQAEKRADSITAAVEQAVTAQVKSKAPKPNADLFTGTYTDPWFGAVTISKQADGHLYFKSKKSADLSGAMQFYKGTTYVVRWDDASLKADAFVIFSLDTEGRANGFTMKPISPLTDFSYDFQDLEFDRVE